jgi:hypothetical protein
MKYIKLFENFSDDTNRLVDMIMGTNPSYELMEDELISKCGYYTGGHRDDWTWEKVKLSRLSKEELESIYTKLKGSDDNTDSISLVMGAQPHWRLNDEFERFGYGEYRGGMNDEWIWNKSALRKLSKEELDDIYKRCKESLTK